jgi:hypothetical protein
VTTDPFASAAALPGVEAAITAARAAVDRVSTNSRLRSDPGPIRAETAIRGARAAANLDGFRPDVDDPLFAGALRVSAELPSAAATWRRAPRQALARLHTLAALDVVATADLGRPESTSAARRLDLLAGALTTATAAPAMVVAGIVHGDLIASAAFGNASGIVARAASRLVLLTRGVDAEAVIALEVGHAGLGLTEYQKYLDGYSAGSAVGLAGWLRHCAAAIGLAAADVLDVCAGAGRIS